jgi:hypothetical protein
MRDAFVAIFCFNYSLYKMAALMILWNRFSSYFAKREEDLTSRSEACSGCTKDEKQLCESCYDEIAPNICTACNKEIPDIYYKHEQQMCKCCYEISLGGEKRCAIMWEMKDITLFVPVGKFGRTDEKVVLHIPTVISSIG